jgi:transposase
MEVFGMSYSPSFREFVVKKVASGMSRSEAMEFFNISRDSLYRWCKDYAETGRVLDKKRKEYKAGQSKKS